LLMFTAPQTVLVVNALHLLLAQASRVKLTRSVKHIE